MAKKLQTIQQPTTRMSRDGCSDQTLACQQNGYSESRVCVEADYAPKP